MLNRISFGGRNERSDVNSAGGGPIDPNTGNPRFDPPQSRNLSANSGSLGLLWSITPTLALAASVVCKQDCAVVSDTPVRGGFVAAGIPDDNHASRLRH